MKLIMHFLLRLFAKLPVKNIILFESMSGFQDNSKALFEEMITQQLDTKYRMIWFVADPEALRYHDYPNVQFMKKSGLTRKSLRYLYYNCVAKYCFYTHETLGYRRDNKQIRFFLTHGTPLKDSRGCFGPTEHHTYILTTSSFSANLRSASLLGGEDKMQILGFPRNDVMFHEEAGTNLFLEEYNYEKLIVWLPTFKRINNSDRMDFGIDMAQDISLMSPEFFQTLNEKLAVTNTLLIIKFHPNQDLRFVSFYDLSHIVTLSNAEMLEEGIDLYALLGKSDALITDFSSVYFDYLLQNKPIGFELGDIANYSSGRGFLVDQPLDYMPGKKIREANDFFKFIEQVATGQDEHVVERAKLCTKMNHYNDNNSAKRIIKFLEMDGISA